jgi:hypothetical protein
MRTCPYYYDIVKDPYADQEEMISCIVTILVDVSSFSIAIIIDLFSLR